LDVALVLARFLNFDSPYQLGRSEREPNELRFSLMRAEFLSMDFVPFTCAAPTNAKTRGVTPFLKSSVANHASLAAMSVSRSCSRTRQCEEFEGNLRILCQNSFRGMSISQMLVSLFQGFNCADEFAFSIAAVVLWTRLAVAVQDVITFRVKLNGQVRGFELSHSVVGIV
jgi:hypothetical protein